jgi:hypothetical protein
MLTHLIRRWRPLLGTALVAFATGPALRAQTPEEIFSGANAAYEQGRYDDAAQGYRTLIKYQIRDPRVEYNLGNTEFRSGRLGKAILHFERARRLDPTDHDIRANLAYARSFCFDQVPVSDAPALLLWLRAGQDRLGPDRQAWIFLGLFWALCMIIAWTLSRPGRSGAGIGWLASALVVLLLIVAVSWYTTYLRLEGSQSGVVLAASVEVLAGPGENNPTLFTVHEGLIVEIRDVRPEWIQVSLPDGLNGWMVRNAVEPV